MKFVPRHNKTVGRTVIQTSDSAIILIDETRVTKYVLIDAVGPDAAARGLKVGDLVLPFRVYDFVLKGGAIFRPIVQEEDVALVIKDLAVGELSVQTDNGKKFVLFDSPDAAKSLGAQEEDYIAPSKAAE